MIYDENQNSYILVSGRILYANEGILGLGPCVKDGVTEGYDGWVEVGEDSLTYEEREDIANEMIRRWMHWKECT